VSSAGALTMNGPNITVRYSIQQYTTLQLVKRCKAI